MCVCGFTWIHNLINVTLKNILPLFITANSHQNSFDNKSTAYESIKHQLGISPVKGITHFTGLNFSKHCSIVENLNCRNSLNGLCIWILTKIFFMYSIIFYYYQSPRIWTVISHVCCNQRSPHPIPVVAHVCFLKKQNISLIIK